MVMTSPREQSISSARQIVTDWPATAWSRSPSRVTMRDTLEVLPDGSTRTTSPGRTVPLFTNPEKPRKSRLGRLTHCTAIRNGAAASRSLSSGTVSRCSLSAGTVYLGVFGERLAMLSPLKPDIGIAPKLSTPLLFANAERSEEHV